MGFPVHVCSGANSEALTMLQHFMKVYGDHFLENIRKSSRELDLSLDGVQETQPSPPPNLQTLKAKVPNGKKLAPAKFEAWKKWEEDGLSIERIAVSYLKSFFP